MVPQSRQDRNDVISDFIALQQEIAIQVADVDCAVPEQHIGAAELGLHSHRRFPNIEYDLFRKSSKQPKRSKAVFSHAQRYGCLIFAL